MNEKNLPHTIIISIMTMMCVIFITMSLLEESKLLEENQLLLMKLNNEILASTNLTLDYESKLANCNNGE